MSFASLHNASLLGLLFFQLKVVTNMRDSYDREMDDLREQMAKAAQTAAAAAVATVSAEAYVQAQNTGHTSTVREPTPPSIHAPSVSYRRAPSHVSTHQKNPSLHEHAVQTEPMPLPRSRPATPFTMPKPLATVVDAAPSTLLLQLEEREAELRALKLFHDEKPQMLLSDLGEAAYKLNSEIRSLASVVSESVPLGRTWEIAQAWALEAAEPSLEICFHLLSGVKGADFAKDPTLVRLALQAWIVICLQRVFDRFLFGLEDAEDETFRIVYDRLQARGESFISVPGSRRNNLIHMFLLCRFTRSSCSLACSYPKTRKGARCESFVITSELQSRTGTCHLQCRDADSSRLQRHHAIRWGT